MFVRVERQEAATSLLVAYHILHALKRLVRKPKAQRQIVALAAAQGFADQRGNPRTPIA